MLAEMLSTPIGVRATLTEASFGDIPSSVDRTVRGLLGVDRFLGLPLVVEGELYGTAVLALQADVPDPPQDVVKAFGHLAAVSLRQESAEREARLASRQLDSFFDLSADILGTVDVNGTILRVNPAWESILGWRPEEVEGHDIVEFQHPDDVQRSGEALARLRKGRPVADFVNRQRHRDGSYREIEWRITPFDGRVGFAVGRDVTERTEEQRREQKRLREEADQARLLLGLYAQAPDLSDEELYARVLEDAVTLTRSEIGFLNLVADDGHTIVPTAWSGPGLQDTAEGHESRHPVGRPEDWAESVRLKRPVYYNDDATDPDLRSVPEGHPPVRRFLSVPVLTGDAVTTVFGVGNKQSDYDDGDVARVELVAHELHKILEARAAESELRRASAYHRSLLEASLDPLVAIGPDGLITDVNDATVRATGRTRQELLGTDFADYCTDPERAKAAYERAFREGTIRDYPLQIKHRDGSLTEVVYNASTYRDPGGSVTGVLAAARDVAELKRAEEEIRALNTDLERRVAERTRELDAANRQLQEFVYSVAHDLRTPLRSVDGFSLAVLEAHGDALGADGRSDLRRVRAAAQTMGELIDALLSLTRVAHRRLRFERVDLSVVAGRVVDELRRADGGREVEVTIAGGLAADTDEPLVEVVLQNLLGNAWKFTAARPVAHIEVGRADLDGMPAFFVRDDGVGFDPAYVGKLFVPFQRLHAAEEFPGTGIGLATVARVLERLGGSWRAEGEVDAGATFFFTLGPGAEEAR